VQSPRRLERPAFGDGAAGEGFSDTRPIIRASGALLLERLAATRVP
jgi:hypothetical protein